MPNDHLEVKTDALGKRRRWLGTDGRMSETYDPPAKYVTGAVQQAALRESAMVQGIADELMHLNESPSPSVERALRDYRERMPWSGTPDWGPSIPLSEHAWQNFRALEGYLDEWAATVLPNDWAPVSLYWVTSPTSPVWTKKACTINQHGQCYLRCDIVTPVVPHPQQIGAEIHRWHMTVNLWNRDYRSPGLPRQLAQMAVAFVTECWRQLEAERR